METNEQRSTQEQLSVQASVNQSENVKREVADLTSAEDGLDEQKPNHHKSAIYAASLLHSAVKYVKPHHHTRLEL